MKKIQFFSDGWRRSQWVDDLNFLVENVRGGFLEESNTQWARDLIAEGRKDVYSKEKSRMFRTFSAGAVYDGNGFRKGNVVSLTGYVTIDIDDIADYDTACMVRDGLFDDDVLSPVVAFVSPSGCGVKAIFRVDGLDGGGTTEEMAERYAKAYNDLNGCIALRKPYIFGDDVRFVLDSSGKDMTRCCFMGYDEDCQFDASEPVMHIPYSKEEIQKELERIEFNVGVVRTDVDGEYDAGEHRNILDDILSSLHRDGNGGYIYNKEKRVQIGHRSNGTAVVDVDGRMGYDLMLPINSVAMFLFGNDRSLADSFLGNSFPEYGKAGWNRVSMQHGDCLPAVNVFRWVLGELEFESDKPKPVETKMTVVGDVMKSKYISNDGSFFTDVDLPPILTRWLDDTSVPPQFRDIRFYSALTLLSGFAVHQGIMVNAGSKKSLNLQTLVIGRQGSGKSEMEKPYNVLLNSLDIFCDFLNGKEEYRHKKEMSDGKHTKMNPVGGDAWAMLGDEEDVDGGGKQLFFKNNIGKPTYAAIMKVLPSNNGKCVMMTSEMSNWEKIEKGQNSGIRDAMKVFYDNGTLSNETVTNMMNGSVTHCYRCNCAVLASGTPDQFRSLFTSLEGGEIRRGLVFLTKDEKWRMLPIHSSYCDNTDIESFFLQWYFYHFYSGVVERYIPTEEDEAQIIKFFNEYVPSIESVFGGSTVAEEAMSGLIRSIHVTVMRIAALIQSLCDFYASDKWDRDFDIMHFNRTHRINVWCDALDKWVERTPDEYIELARSGMKFTNEVDENVRLDLKYVWLAQKLVHSRLSDTFTTIETYDKKALPAGVSNPSNMKYMNVLKNLSMQFTPAQFLNAYKVMYNEEISKQYVHKCLSRLVVKSLIKKVSHGNYEQRIEL